MLYNLLPQNAGAVNLFCITKMRKVQALRISQKRVDECHQINLLLIWDACGRRSHYVYIRSMSALLRTQITSHEHQHFFCFHCLRSCTSPEVLAKHKLRCKADRQQHERFPERGNENGPDRCFYKNAEYEVKRPYVIYADFETLPQPVHGPAPNPEVNIIILIIGMR